MENFRYVLYLFTCAAKGKPAERVKDINIREILNISAKHGIWSIVFIAVKQLYKKDNTVFGLNDELFKKLDTSFAKTVSKNVIKWSRLPGIVNEISDAGINVCLLKGLTLGILYNEPYSRSTTDVDLLVGSEDEEKVCKILETKGFNIKHKWEGSHHTKCTRTDVGLVEIHTQLYDKEVQSLWFEMNSEQNFQYNDFEFDGLRCKQLNATDGLIFNFLHFVKHYISGLVTVKQLMDVMLYIKNYKSDIDFDKFDDVISSLNYFKLYKTFKCVAVKYLGFTPEELNEDYSLSDYSDDAELILEDMDKYAGTEKGSIYHIYTQNLKNKKTSIPPPKEDFGNKTNKIFRLLWADKRRMVELYGEAYEKKYLKPFYQANRIFLRIFNIKKVLNKKSVAQTKELTEAKERISLFEKLDVI